MYSHPEHWILLSLRLHKSDILYIIDTNWIILQRVINIKLINYQQVSIEHWTVFVHSSLEPYDTQPIQLGHSPFNFLCAKALEIA